MSTYKSPKLPIIISYRVKIPSEWTRDCSELRIYASFGATVKHLRFDSIK